MFGEVFVESNERGVGFLSFVKEEKKERVEKVEGRFDVDTKGKKENITW